MKSKFTLLLFFISPLALLAQNQLSYNQKAEEIKKTVWEKQNPIFESNKIPEKYNNESAVILARSFDMQRVSGGKFKFMVITATSVTQTNKTTTFREKIKINDKAALDEYSTLEYDKIIDKTETILTASIKNKKEVFIGVKIIKSNGKELIVNTNEEVILQNSKKDKVGKLAIPDLQVGDILDYYISTIQVKEGNQEEDENRYTFFLANEYPVLNFAYKFQYGKKISVFNISANGAPQPIISTNNDGDQIFTYTGTDIPKYKDEIWSSPYRDLPYFCISSSFKTKYDQMLMASANPLSKLDKIDPKLSRLDNYINNFQAIFNTNFVAFSDDITDQAKEHFKSSKALKNAPLDSSMKVIYNNWRYSVFCDYDADNFDISEMNYRVAKSKINTVKMCKILCDLEIPHDILVATSKFSNSLSNVFETGDFQTMIRINGSKPMYMFFDRVNTHFNEIPVYYQGEKALVLTPRRKGDHNYTFTRSEATIPVTKTEDNLLIENLKVNFSKDDMQHLNITRNVNEKGSMKTEDQLRLCYVEDIDKELTTLTQGEELKKRLKDKKTYNNLQQAFDFGRKDIKKSFTAEITSQYEQAPKDVTDFKVIKTGISNALFEYESKFTMENFVKKAGSNYILDVGKLIGKISKIDADKKDRQTNIYMSSARALNYNIDIEIPAGYKVSGASDLNVNITNDKGHFNATSKIDGQKLLVEVKRAYHKASIDKKEWNDLVSLVDAAGNFYERKVLLEKIN